MNDIPHDDRPLSELYRLAAKQWSDKESAASLLEELKSAVLSQKMAALGDLPVSRAELHVKASAEWEDYVRKMVEARTEANLAKVKLEWVRLRFSEWQSAEANARSEKRL
jgi:hypothetical protein